MRTVTVPIRMSPDERKRLAVAAARAGLPLGTWLRSLGLAATRGSGRHRAEVIAKLRGSLSGEEADAMRDELRKSRAERS
ncbi:MAG: plasmid mobilization protein [Myxococcales bacterium]